MEGIQKDSVEKKVRLTITGKMKMGFQGVNVVCDNVKQPNLN